MFYHLAEDEIPQYVDNTTCTTDAGNEQIVFSSYKYKIEVLQNIPEEISQKTSQNNISLSSTPPPSQLPPPPPPLLPPPPLASSPMIRDGKTHEVDRTEHKEVAKRYIPV